MLEIDRLPRLRLGITGGTYVGITNTKQDALVLDGFETVGIHRLTDARHHGDVGAVDGLQLANAVGNAFGDPCVADDGGHTNQIDVGRRGEHHHGDTVVKHLNHVGVEDNLLFLLGIGSQCAGQHGSEQDSSDHAFSKIVQFFHNVLVLFETSKIGKNPLLQVSLLKKQLFISH